MRMTLRTILPLALIFVTVGLLAGCISAPQPAVTLPTETPQPRAARATLPPTYTAAVFELLPTGTRLPTETPIPFGAAATYVPVLEPGSFPSNVNPLTGQVVSNVALLQRRPLAIKISNFPRDVRTHQYGLNAADHLWEYYLEDELTRFAGVYLGRNVERVGPVRSARPFDEQILRMYKGILTFAYADRRLMDEWVNNPDIAPYMVIQKPDNCPPMCRIGPENDYNTLYTDTALLSQYATERGTTNERQDLEGLRFETSGQPATGGYPAERVEIRFSPESYLYWQYPPDSGRYLRWQDSQRAAIGEEVYAPLIDSLDDSQVAADNLIVLLVPSGYVYVSNSTEVHQHEIEGSGQAFVLRDGRIFEVVWRREKRKNLVTLWLANGRPYLLKPGNVWYEVLSVGTQFLTDGEMWRFNFYVPPVPTVTPKYTATSTPYR